MLKVLVANIGSTSFKYKLINMDNESTLAMGKVERVGTSKALLAHYSAGKDKLVMEVDAPDHTSAIKLVMNTLLDSEIGEDNEEYQKKN